MCNIKAQSEVSKEEDKEVSTGRYSRVRGCSEERIQKRDGAKRECQGCNTMGGGVTLEERDT